jgi:hypothetical protein
VPKLLSILSILLTRSTSLAACAAMLSVALNSAHGQIRIEGEILTDPTKPILSSTPVRGEPTPKPETIQQLFTVGFVRASEKAPIAIVNGMQVSIGSVVDGAEILAISATGVELEIEGERQSVAAFGSVVKTFEQ